jgi:hypothetical protein
MPFGTYTKFDQYDITDQTTFSFYIVNRAYGSYSFVQDLGASQSVLGSSSGFANQSYNRNEGAINGTSTLNYTSSNEGGGTTDIIQGYFTASGSDGATTDHTHTYAVSFLENQGFASTFETTPTTYYFSDFTDDSAVALSLSHGQTTSGVNLRQTSSTELTFTPPIGDSTTYSQVTSYITNSDRSFTGITSVTEYGTAIYDIAGCNKIIGLGYVVFPVAGTNWTVDGTALMYQRLFTDTGTYGEYYSGIFKDNTASPTTIIPVESYLAPNGTARGDQIVTLFSDVTGVITYDVTGQESESFSIADSYNFNGSQFVLNTGVGSSTFWQKPYKTSSELSYTNQYGATIGPFGNSGGASWIIGGAISSTRLINVDTTISSFLYSFANTKSTYISYRALAKTLSTLSYVLYNYDEDNTWGSRSSSSSSQSATTNINTVFSVTVNDSRSGATTESLVITYLPRLSRKCLYSLEYYSSINPTFFTQQSPNFNWVVADSANLSFATKYFDSLSPSQALTKLYFTTYKYHRYGIVNPPVFAVPIDFTNESDSSYTYQAVSVPTNFYFGENPASATQTYSVLDGTTFTISTFTIGYAGEASGLKMKEKSFVNDFSGNGDPNNYDRIFHTIAVEQSSSGCAEWSMDNYYYWVGGSSRVISGTASNPISIIGDYHPFTMIASSWGNGNPYVAIDVTHQNSYSYNY